MRDVACPSLESVLLDAVPDGIVGVDQDLVVVSANRAACRLLGSAGSHALVGRCLQDVVEPTGPHRRSSAWADAAFGEVARGAGAAELEVRSRVSAQAASLRCSATGWQGGGAGSGALLVLREAGGVSTASSQREMLASMVDTSSDVALVGLPDGRVHWMNAAGRGLLGFGADEPIDGYRIEDLFDAEEMERVYRDVMPVVVADHEWVGELSVQARDGSPIPVWATLHAHTGENGDRRHVSAMMRDLRPRIEQEGQVRASERRLAEAQRLVQLGSWEWDIVSGLVEWSTELHRLFGTDPATHQPTFASFMAKVHADDQALVQAAVDEAIETNGEYACEFRVVQPAGGVRVADAHGLIVTDAQGEAIRLVGTLQDVTDLRELDRLKGEFVAVVSHELRTPLTSIHGALRLLQAGLLATEPERAQRLVDIAERNTGRLIRLINDILDVERLASGKIELQPREVAFDELLDRSLEVMRPMAASADVVLVAQNLPLVVEADPDRVEQVVTNLVSNAIKFSPSGGTVRINVDVAGREVLVRVVDEGRGIPPEMLEQVFDRFRQVDPSDVREKDGTGLGLSICRSIVDQHGGRIWAESEPGHGTTLTFTLPLATGSTAVTTEPASRELILLCDDDDEGREAVAAILQARGFDVVQASDGRTALELAATVRPALILLDLLMPGLDGWQTATLLKQQSATRTVPIVILSVVPEPEANVELDTIVGYIEKSLGPVQLLAAIDGAIAHRPRLLIVEDDVDLAGILSATFEPHDIDVVHARTGAAALALCEQVPPDLVVLDLGLPDIDGAEVIDWLRHHDHLADVPVVVYTAADLTGDDQNRLANQATSVLVKSRITPAMFEHHVLGLIARITARDRLLGR